MKYFIIAGEASGDLHAAHLIAALRQRDSEARFRFFGGDLMLKAAGDGLLRHYDTLAYMGFIQVALHARTILRGITQCKEAIAAWRPDVLILVDYPGFNLKIARWARTHLPATPVVYYISPKIWAWKEYRIRDIRNSVDRMLSILPFEVDYYSQRHSYPVTYVGNPTYDEVAGYLHTRGEDIDDIGTYGQQAAGRTATIALLPGSRRQEIRDNLTIMLDAIRRLTTTLPPQHLPEAVTIAAAPGIPDAFYNDILRHHTAAARVSITRGKTYDLLRTAATALVTSGTATLEAALLDVPQIVCYKMTGGRIVNWLRPHIIKCPYISLVNLIADSAIVPELIAADMHTDRLTTLLTTLHADNATRHSQLQGYADMRRRLATPGAPQRAADEILQHIGTPAERAKELHRE